MADSNNEIANLKIMNEVRIFSGLQNFIKKIYINTILYTYSTAREKIIFHYRKRKRNVAQTQA